MKCQICNNETQYGEERYINELDVKLFVCHECVKPIRKKVSTLSVRLPEELASKLPKEGKSAFVRDLLYKYFASKEA